ncbi:MAG: hypothetical protein M3P32_06160 [Chloroflexota bacterium]|nr:hypothetical protein [Chloroflexota bacterium]
MTTLPGDDPLVAALAEQLQSMRAAERDVFGVLDPVVRDRPMRPGDWSPKDHQAHLTAWKGIQTDRILAARRGETLAADTRETDERNAELQALRASWSWEEIVQEADDVSTRLEAEIVAAGSALLLATDGLIGRIYGNSSAHALTHFAWLADAGIGVDEARVAAFLEEHERHLVAAPLPDADRGVSIYNLACAHAVAHRLDRARSLLRVAFQLRPDLAEFAKEDPDLSELRDELPSLLA